ncbi:MAG: diaminopimelate epimerase [Bdellovibrio sp.]
MQAYHYSATGNTFLVFDNRKGEINPFQTDYWSGVAGRYGVDGLIFLQTVPGYDFGMCYLNSDGSEESMCGNGMRTLGHFAFFQLGIKPRTDNKYSVKAKNQAYEVMPIDPLSVHMCEVFDEQKIDVSDLYPLAKKSYYINTGVPHAVYEVDSVAKIDIEKVAPPIRHDKRFKNGVNVNFFQVSGYNEVNMRTFERGVEGETKSCGTGATATALACRKLFGWKERVRLNTPGGILDVTFDDDGSNVWLAGAVNLVQVLTI